MQQTLSVFLTFFWFAFACGSAGADLIEIRNEGFVNGEIVAQDDVTATIKEKSGNVRSLPRANVLRVEPELASAGVSGKVMGRIKSLTKKITPKWSWPWKPKTTKELLAEATNRSKPLAQRKEALKKAMQQMVKEKRL